MISVILAGGANTRYPTHKAFIEVEGQSIISRSLELLKEVSDEVFISTNEPERFFHLGVPMVGDTVKDSGPLAGIVSSFQCTGAKELLVVACDMPFIHKGVVEYIINNSEREATVAMFDGKAQPLLAVYGRKAVERALSDGRCSLMRLLDEIDTKYIEEDVIRGIDPEGNCFMNINTPEDYDRAMKIKQVFS